MSSPLPASVVKFFAEHGRVGGLKGKKVVQSKAYYQRISKLGVEARRRKKLSHG